MLKKLDVSTSKNNIELKNPDEQFTKTFNTLMFYDL